MSTPINPDEAAARLKGFTSLAACFPKGTVAPVGLDDIAAVLADRERLKGELAASPWLRNATAQQKEIEKLRAEVERLKDGTGTVTAHIWNECVTERDKLRAALDAAKEETT